MKVRVTRATDNNWYKVGEKYEVEEKLTHDRHGFGDYHALLGEKGVGISPLHFEIIDEQPEYPFFVRCIDVELSAGYLEFGKTYKAIGDYHGSDYFLEGVHSTWSKDRFEIVKEEDADHMAEAKKALTKLNDLRQDDKFQTYIPDPEEEKLVRNKYQREIKPGVWVDVYDVLRAWEVTDPCLQHLLKKALQPGKRHHKDLEEDLQDILASAKRAVEMYEEWHQK